MEQTEQIVDVLKETVSDILFVVKKQKEMFLSQMSDKMSDTKSDKGLMVKNSQVLQ